MSEERGRDHITVDELEDYFAARLSESGEIDLEHHFTDCPGCLDNARMFSALRHLSAQSYAETLQGLALAKADREAQAKRAVAAIVVNFNRPNLFTPLPSYAMAEINARAAGEQSIDTVERGEMDFLPSEQVPTGSMLEALDSERMITVVVPCENNFEQTPPHIELLLEDGQIITTEPEKESRYIRERAQDPSSICEKECWVAYFEALPLEQIIVIVCP